jgi:hypothetical protein
LLYLNNAIAGSFQRDILEYKACVVVDGLSKGVPETGAKE